MPEINPPKAVVKKRFDFSAERIFDAWLDPAMIGQWMFGPSVRDEEVVRLSVDARVGGAFSFVVRRKGEEIDHGGRYAEIRRPERLSFTWGIAGDFGEESAVYIDIKPLGKACELTLVHELHPNWADYARLTEAAWGRMLDVLAAQL